MMPIRNLIRCVALVLVALAALGAEDAGRFWA